MYNTVQIMNGTTYTEPTQTKSYRTTFAASLITSVLVAAASIAGLILPDWVYPNEALRRFALANDLANLVIGVPVLLGSMWLSKRDELAGLLLWPGALMYTFYNYFAYMVSVPPSWVYLSYPLIVCLSFYSTIAIAASIDRHGIQMRLRGSVPERLSGGVLIILGGFVIIRVFAVFVTAILEGTGIAPTDFAVLLADLLISPAWVIGGSALWRKTPFGYLSGLSLLFQGSMLFIGLMFVLTLQPVFTGDALPLTDLVVVALMGLICFVPTGLFIRGVQRTKLKG